METKQEVLEVATKLRLEEEAETRIEEELLRAFKMLLS